MMTYMENMKKEAIRKGSCLRHFLIPHFSFILLLFSCSSDDVAQQPEHQTVAVDFALTVAKSASPGNSSTTRMPAGDLEGTAGNVTLKCALPFTVADATVSKPVGVNDEYTSSPIETFDQPRNSYAYFTSSCDFNQGTNAILAYATPKATSSLLLKEKGKLEAAFGDYQPANINFHLQTIMLQDQYLGTDRTEDVQTIPEQLAAYLTTIANTSIGTGDDIKTWKAYANDESKNAQLRILFKNFTNQLSDDVGEVLPGSSANVKAWVTELKRQLIALTLTDNSDDDLIRDAIIDNIDANYNKLTSTDDWKDFPSSKNLPDGAAVVRWDGEKFVPETQTTTIADINNLERFTYPAEIYYYGNSATWVSYDDLSDNFRSKTIWKNESNPNDPDAVLSGFTKGAVEAATKTVAMGEPLHYGVGQLKVQLKGTTSATLKDSKNADITVGTENFKLTGIIVGGQLPVGFDFRPESRYESYSEQDMRFIYDSQVNTNGTGGTDPFYMSTVDATKDIQTLVLQSYTGKSLKLALEFEYVDDNNSTVDNFKGLNGYVYEGTKFYLVGEVVPTIVDTDPKVYDNRVFTQDHITTISVKVRSLAKAYNVLPNLLSPRLEMGLELTPKWVQVEPTDVIL